MFTAEAEAEAPGVQGQPGHLETCLGHTHG